MRSIVILTQPTLDKLSTMNLGGLREAIEEQLASAQYSGLPFEERLALAVEREWTRRENARLERRLKSARFIQSACIEDLDISASRGLVRRQILSLSEGAWLRHHLNLIISGPTGSGKSFLATAFGNAAWSLAQTGW